MLDAIRAYFTLEWTQKPKYHPLPPHVTRDWVTTAGGPLELLVSEPSTRPSVSSTTCPPPVFFVHGGEGHAAVWLEWMGYLSTCYGARTYAYSLRSHGASYAVPFWRMVWRTSLDDLADDLTVSIDEVRRREGQDPVIVAHSSGGGLSQYVLSRGRVHARGLSLVGAVPHWGNMSVYANWFRRIDPWFGVRSIFHLYHPNSPLSTPTLVHNAFFGPDYPISRVPEFMRWMSNYEAMWWPFGMAGRGWGIDSRTWLQPTDIVRRLVSGPPGADKVMVMVGTADRMMGGTEDRMFREYREAIRTLGKQGPRDIAADADADAAHPVVVDALVTEQWAGGVRLVLVKNAGHHTQNDMQWEASAEALHRYLEQV